MKKYVAIVAVTVLVCCLVFWVGAIIRYDAMTAQHIDEFLGFEEVRNADKTKILTYYTCFASVYCVAPNRHAGNIYHFIRDPDTWEWKFYMWDTVWSSAGNADGFVWPYIR